MKNGKIYLRDGEGLVAMTEQPYEAEVLLQRLLADYPDLLAGDQIRPEAPRRWLLVTQEAPVPDVEGGAGRWSLDHLFVDQDSVPTLVEVKRSSDTRARREVVAQMLDYAANIAAYWPIGEVRSIFEARCSAEGLDPVGETLTFLDEAGVLLTGPDAGDAVDSFWQRVGDNIAARRLRLVFVADSIPPELQRIIEFLNGGLVSVDVLAVEVKQYLGQGRQTLVPRVIGWTTEAEVVKRGASGQGRSPTIWDRDSFRAATAEAGGPEALRVLDGIVAWADRQRYPTSFGKGYTGPQYVDVALEPGLQAHLTGVFSSGSAIIDFAAMKKHPPFDRPEKRVELHERLMLIPDAELDGKLERRKAENASWYYLTPRLIGPDAGLRALCDALDWMAAELAGQE